MNSMFEPTHFPSHIKLPSGDDLLITSPQKQLENLQQQMDTTHKDWVNKIKKARPIVDDEKNK
jgi:hypothetical protein